MQGLQPVGAQASLAQTATDTADVHVQTAVVLAVLALQRHAVQVGFAQRLTAVADQQPEQTELQRRQRQIAACDPCQLGVAVQVQFVDLLQRPGVLQGQTLYRDARSAIAGYAGPVRQICEILDYRYARYADQPGYVLHPVIDRGWARDLQLWVATSSAVAAESEVAAAGRAEAERRVALLTGFLAALGEELDAGPPPAG